MQQKEKAKRVEKARNADIARVKKGEFVTNKMALRALEKSGAKKTTTKIRMPVPIPKKLWKAVAISRKLDPEKVVAMLTDLGFSVCLTAD